MSRAASVCIIAILAGSAHADDGLEDRLANAFNRSLSVAPQRVDPLPTYPPTATPDALEEQIKRAQLIRLYQEAARIPPVQYQIVQPQPLQQPQPIRPLGPQLSCRSYRNLAGQIQTDCY